VLTSDSYYDTMYSAPLWCAMLFLCAKKHMQYSVQIF